MILPGSTLEPFIVILGHVCIIIEASLCRSCGPCNVADAF